MRSPRRHFAPGEKTVVFEPGLAVREAIAGEVKDMAAGGFEHRLAGGGVPLHRRAEARVEIGIARREHAKFEGAAAFPALRDRPSLKVLGEAAAVLVAAAVHDDDAVRPGRARLDRCKPAAAPLAHRGARTVRG